MEEIWKDIVGYENIYQISNLGRVKSLNYNHTGREKILKPSVNKDGYILKSSFICNCYIVLIFKQSVHKSFPS